MDAFSSFPSCLFWSFCGVMYSKDKCNLASSTLADVRQQPKHESQSPVSPCYLLIGQTIKLSIFRPQNETNTPPSRGSFPTARDLGTQIFPPLYTDRTRLVGQRSLFPSFISILPSNAKKRAFGRILAWVRMKPVSTEKKKKKKAKNKARKHPPKRTRIKVNSPVAFGNWRDYIIIINFFGGGGGGGVWAGDDEVRYLYSL